MNDRKFDVVIFGATGFTGRQAAAYMKQHAPTSRLGLAGRNQEKLSNIAQDLGLSEDHLIMADSSVEQSISEMVQQARVIINTAGPFARHGEPVIRYCIEHGTDYVDITGETPFVRDMIDRYHKAAAAKGVKIVPFCGFDSVPSDLGTYWLVSLMRAKNLDVKKVKAFFRLKGGFNGGTVASALNLAETNQSHRLADPLLLNPPQFRSKEEAERSFEPQRPLYDPDLKVWTAPFFMAPINSAVVRRSRSIFRELGQDYGPNFEYHERLLVNRRGTLLSAALVAGASGIFYAANSSELGRKLIRKLAPEPGEGPSEKSMDEGYFRCMLYGESQSGEQLAVQIKGRGDPGNRITVKLLCESALLLISSRNELPGGGSFGGILTPATAFGLKLKKSLEEKEIGFQILKRREY